MGRLIDIDRLCDDLVERWSIADKKKEELIRAVMADVVTPIVVSQPTVDAVEVVRCKDCKHWKTVKGVNLSKRVRFCTYHIGHQYARHDEDFCSRGERKDGEAHD